MFTERIQLDDRCRVDREAKVIYGVTLSGPVSRNKRRYSQQARQAIAQHTGSLSVDMSGHVDRKKGERRQPLDLNGSFENSRIDEDGMVRADWRLFPNHATTAGILDLAELHPGIGMLSHEVLKAEYEEHDDGWVDINDVEKMSHFALVDDGGITKSIFEAKEDDDMPKLTLQELTEQYTADELTAAYEACCGVDKTQELQDQLTQALKENEDLKSELNEVRSKLKVHEDKQEAVEQQQRIREQAKELVHKNYEVPEKLMESLLLLDEDHRATMLENVSFTEDGEEQPPAGGDERNKPQSKSPLSGNEQPQMQSSFTRLASAPTTL